MPAISQLILNSAAAGLAAIAAVDAASVPRNTFIANLLNDALHGSVRQAHADVANVQAAAVHEIDISAKKKAAQTTVLARNTLRRAPPIP